MGNDALSNWKEPIKYQSHKWQGEKKKKLVIAHSVLDTSHDHVPSTLTHFSKHPRTCTFMCLWESTDWSCHAAACTPARCTCLRIAAQTWRGLIFVAWLNPEDLRSPSQFWWWKIRAWNMYARVVGCGKETLGNLSRSFAIKQISVVVWTDASGGFCSPSHSAPLPYLWAC